MSSLLPAFLRLPYELRYEIYGLVLDQRLGYFPRFYLAISLVNRQIRQEVFPLILQNSRYFSSLDKFSDWTSRGEAVLLKQIQNVTVHVFDDSLIPVAEALAVSKEVKTNRRTPKFWKTVSAPQFGRSPLKPGSRESLRSRILCALHLAKYDLSPGPSKDAITSVWDAFTAINGVKKLWLLFKDSTHPSSCRSFPIEQELLLDIIATACHKVQDFTVFSELVALDYLGHFQDLRSIRFSGYSKSSPEETLTILQGLKKLETLIIYRYPEGYDIDNNIITSKLPDYLSVTSDVVASMNSLKHVQISHMSSFLPCQHISVPIFRALRNHVSSLRIFQLSSDYALNAEIVEELLSLLAASSITDLRIRIKIPKKFESQDPMSFFPKKCKNGEASTRNSDVEGLVHLVMTASGRYHNITHPNRVCICGTN